MQAERRACVLPGTLKLGCFVQPSCAHGLDTTFTMPGCAGSVSAGHVPTGCSVARGIASEHTVACDTFMLEVSAHPHRHLYAHPRACPPKLGQVVRLRSYAWRVIAGHRVSVRGARQQGLEAPPWRACLCEQQNMPRALPGWWKLGCRMQPSCAQCRLVTFTMPVR